MNNWTSEYIFHFLKIQIHIANLIDLRKELKEMENKNPYKNQIVYRIYHKKKNHLRRKLTTIKFWDKKWRVLRRIFEAWKSAIPLGRFSFLPSSGNRVGSAQVAKTKFITPCQLSHTYFRGKIRVTRVSGERSRAQWCIPWFPVYERRCRVSLQFYYRSMRDRGYCHKFQLLFETLFLHSNRVKRDHRDSRFES